MSVQKTYPLGPYPVGIDNVSAPSALIAEPKSGRFIALRDAVNVDIDRNGRSSRRSGRRASLLQSGLHSLWSAPDADYGFAAVGSQLYRVADGRMDFVAVLHSADPLRYAMLNGDVIVSSRTTLLRVFADGISSVPVGVADASAPTLAVSSAGGLAAGRYSVAVAFTATDGSAGGLSRLRTVTLAEGQGITLSDLPVAPDAVSLRIYCTHAGGEALYQVAVLPPGAIGFTIGAGQHGTVTASTRDLRRMPSGDHVAAWQGRLLTARGNTLRVSEPMAFGLHSPRHGFVQFDARITMLAPVESGVFVGTRRGVTFLRGAKPRDWVQQVTGALPPVTGAVATLDGNVMAPGMELGGQTLAVWLAGNGYVLGTEAGQVIEIQADRMSIARAVSGALCVKGRRVFAAVQ